MLDQHSYTKPEIARQLRVIANHTSEPEKGRLLNMADRFERERDLVQGTREAIAESRQLLAAVEKARRPQAG